MINFSIANRTLFRLYEVLPGIDGALQGRWQMQLHRRASSRQRKLVPENA
jgi:hypothetical protein